MESPEPLVRPDYRAGFIAVIGKPNVGKSTLMNVLLRQKVAAVSPRPQTTRKRQLGILTTEEAQIIFVDTPGFHTPKHRLGEKMVKAALKAMEDADGLLFLLDVSEPLSREDFDLADQIQPYSATKPLVIALNKIDIAKEEFWTQAQTLVQERFPSARVIPVSCLRGDNLDQLLAALIECLPVSEPLYPADQITDYYEREIAAELIREAALHILRDEVPHGIAVRIDQYQEKNENLAVIDATIIVEKETHKAIVIGAGGSMIKRIGTQARQEIEAMSGRKVFLNLHVKVQKNWRKNETLLRWLGYT
ncbi:MAG: GTPase Era [Anaerolineales bacterium]|nr:GTPase Era [Anaerolineales bacterium]MCS7246624.1 GTPase Era [Anaerolineales bacterium]MDW8160434.1 GTPase Era [Anaerolineales bacterium]MDW8447783.1 GTPase Era [Anaerolineales bacterium]